VTPELIGHIQSISLAALLGLLVGIERAWHHKVASLRTFSMISVGACLFSIISVEGAGDGGHDTTRMAAQIVAGIGFLGGGVIFKTASRVEGITTAAMIWLVAAVGTCCGFGQPYLAMTAVTLWAALNIVCLSLHRLIDMMQGNPPPGKPPK